MVELNITSSVSSQPSESLDFDAINQAIDTVRVFPHAPQDHLDDDYFNALDQLREGCHLCPHVNYLYEERFYASALKIIDRSIFFQTYPDVHAQILPLAVKYFDYVAAFNQLLDQEGDVDFDVLKEKLTTLCESHRIFYEKYSVEFQKHIKKTQQSQALLR